MPRITLQNGTIIDHKLEVVNNIRAIETLTTEWDIVPAEAVTGIGEEYELPPPYSPRLAVIAAICFLAAIGIIVAIAMY